MKNKKLLSVTTLFLSLFLVLSSVALAEEKLDEAIGEEKVGFTGPYPDEVVSPEEPNTPSNPGQTDKNKGELRIDYVPYFFFDKANITKDGSYTLNAHAQYYTKGESPTGNFVQIVDERKANGWSLTLKQEDEFTLVGSSAVDPKEQLVYITPTGEKYHAYKCGNGTYMQTTLSDALSGGYEPCEKCYPNGVNPSEPYRLKGATLSLSHLWASSVHLGVGTTTTPTIHNDVIKMDSGKVYEIANAKGEVGKGRWAIVAGYSDEYAQKIGATSGTIKPMFDSANNPKLLKDSIQNIHSYGFDIEKQQVHTNEAVKLNVPAQDIRAGVYQAKFTWTLTAAP
ncbi:WxL domain surface cell wall-binding [Pilibacter termitis]|uniref:WxL domain surface cell wall-binding n=1 Tax=Pilibacter termitis TaxID=263852 RepID=A0A1T4Q6Y9_9ENTE|nr:WxL domain-containing protein [Pilibacter termitis]SJZ99515.1 WxL domain surface cell wall-binding [Pilibacter termitis]